MQTYEELGRSLSGFGVCSCIKSVGHYNSIETQSALLFLASKGLIETSLIPATAGHIREMLKKAKGLERRRSRQERGGCRCCAAP